MTLRETIMEGLKEGVETDLSSLAMRAGVDRRLVLEACLLLEKRGILKVKKPLFGIFGDFRVVRVRDFSAEEKDSIRPRIIAVANQKGGVGKTITAINLAGCLSRMGKRTLLVDMDPQAYSTSSLVSGKASKTAYEVLVEGAQPDKAVIKTEFQSLEVLASNVNLVGAEVELVGMKGREGVLKKALDRIGGSYDYVVIDCPPSLSLLTINALCACDGVLVPVQCDYFAFEGLRQLLDTIGLVRERLNCNLKLLGILLTMYEPQNPLSVRIAEEARKKFKGAVLKPMIHRDSVLSEAARQRKPIVYFDEDCRASREYIEVASFIVQNG